VTSAYSLPDDYKWGFVFQVDDVYFDMKPQLSLLLGAATAEFRFVTTVAAIAWCELRDT
jgi:hypothetical protein